MQQSLFFTLYLLAPLDSFADGKAVLLLVRYHVLPFKSRSINSIPLSINNTRGIPHRLIIKSSIVLRIFLLLALRSGQHSTHFVNKSYITRRYANPLLKARNGPMISAATTVHGVSIFLHYPRGNVLFDPRWLASITTSGIIRDFSEHMQPIILFNDLLVRFLSA